MIIRSPEDIFNIPINENVYLCNFKCANCSVLCLFQD